MKTSYRTADLKEQDALDMIVPNSFDMEGRKYYGHLNKLETMEFFEEMKVADSLRLKDPSFFQVFVSTGFNNGKQQLSMTSLSHDKSENIIYNCDDNTIEKVEKYFLELEGE